MPQRIERVGVAILLAFGGKSLPRISRVRTG